MTDQKTEAPALVPLSEQDATLLNQAHEMLLEYAEHLKATGNDSAAMGADCSADAVLRLGASAARTGLAAREPEPVLLGRFHHGEGFLCSGSMRVMRADFDTNPSAQFQQQFFDWVCEVMNQHLGRHNAVAHGFGPTVSDGVAKRIGTNYCCEKAVGTGKVVCDDCEEANRIHGSAQS